MLDSVVTILNAASGVTDLVGTDIYIDEAPQGTTPPYIILSQIRGDVYHSKNTVSELDYPILQVDAYAKIHFTKSGVSGAYSIIEAVRTALDQVTSGSLYFRALGTPETLDLTIPNRPLKNAQIEFEVEEKR